MRTDFDYHANRDPAKALNFIKTELGEPVSLVPQVVKLLVGTSTLQSFYTTNFDEVLFAAAGESVAVYPDYNPMAARFIYLHGRAAIATSFHEDLVLGETGYTRAYGGLHGGPANTQVQRLLPVPVLFVGFSMADTGVMWTLRDIAEAARRRTTLGEGSSSEVIASLDWYALLKAPPREDPGRLALKATREDSLRASDVQVIWYADGGDGDQYRALPEVAEKLRREGWSPTVAEQQPGLVETMLDAERLAAVSSPSSSEVRRAQGYLAGHPRVAEAFMDRVGGLEWFRHLRDLALLQPAPSARLPDGARSVPHWFAADFLQRVAIVAPSEVTDFLLTIETDNWVAIRRAFSVLIVLDDPNASSFGSALAGWAINALPDDPWLAVSLAQSAGRLASDGKNGAASALVESALSHIAISNPASLTATRMIAPEFLSVLKQSPSGPGVAVDALRRVLEQEYADPDSDITRYARSSIEVHATQSRRHDESTLGFLIDLVRDTLRATEEQAERTRVVDLLLRSEWPTQRRVGVAHLFLRPTDLSTHARTAITTQNLSDPHLFHEMAKLVVDHADDLSDETIRVLKEFAADLYASTSEAGRYEYERWAAVLRSDWLPAPHEPVSSGEEESERRLFRGFFFREAGEVTAPLDYGDFAERAARMTRDDLLDLVRDPAAAGVEITWRTSAELMWDRLAEYAKEQNQLAPLLGIRSSDLGGDNSSWRAVEAMADLAGDSAERWAEVLRWAEDIVSEASDDTYWSLGQLLVRAGSVAPLALNERIRGLAMRVMARTRRTDADEADLGEQSMLGGFLNHPAGMATQAVFELLRRQMIEDQPAGDSGTGLPTRFEETVLDPLSRDPASLGIDAWIGLGRLYALLSDRAPESVAFVVEHLESESSYRDINSVAFWSGYLWAPGVSSGALTHLMGAYRKFAHALQEDGVLATDLWSAFFQHIVIGALREIPGFSDAVDETLDGNSFNAATRAAIASALGHGIDEASEDPGSSFQLLATGLFHGYWTKHVNQVGGRDGTALATYIDWLGKLQLPPKEVASLIEASLDQARSAWQVQEVLSYLQRYLDTDPGGAIGLLRLCAEWWRLNGNVWIDSDDVSSVLERLAATHAGDALFREVLDGFAELRVISAADAARYLGWAHS